MMLYISMKFHENIFDGFQDIELTRVCDRPTDGQMERQKLHFLLSAYRLIMIYTSMNFMKMS